MKTKMKLSDLKVNSFVTEVQDEKAQTAKGGVFTPLYPVTVLFTITYGIIASEVADC